MTKKTIPKGKKIKIFVLFAFSFLLLTLIVSEQLTRKTDVSLAQVAPPAECFGAEECNPTGSPIGGGAGYNDIITVSDPRIACTATTKAQLTSCVATAASGTVIFIPGDKEIDISNTQLTIPAGVTLASDRGYAGSLGGKIYQTSNSGGWGSSMIKANGPNVRITGLRIEGPYKETSAPVQAIGLMSGYKNFTVDNCEVFGFSWAGILIYGLSGGGASDAYGYIHHNNIHHCRMGGLGYGVGVSENSTALIEANKFDYCREAVSHSGRLGDSYEFRYNWLGATFCEAHPHAIIDAHGTTLSPNQIIAGKWLKIHHNTFNCNTCFAVGISGTPQEGIYIDHNRVMHNINANLPKLSPFLQSLIQGGMYITRNMITDVTGAVTGAPGTTRLWDNGPLMVLCQRADGSYYECTSPDNISPSVPAGLTATATSTSQINLSWLASTDNVGVTGYIIYRNGTQITNITGASYQNTGLSTNTTYSYTVAAHDAAGNVSAQSSQVQAATQSSLPQSIIGDINKDGKVDIYDVSFLLSKWGSTDSTDLQECDINLGPNNVSQAKIDIYDANLMMKNWTG